MITRKEGSQTKIVDFDSVLRHSKMVAIDTPTASTFQIASESGLAVMLFSGAKTRLPHSVKFPISNLAGSNDALSQ